ncbi:hypothetical protein GCM10010840_36340 [Deinococcus aerolatus]|uniref:Uncharacterized protein n=2 Tax=Deinococcus aerolatus TaxID=522487 RepID=A0ABQ2GGB0_9DEIO|nr:hypothetical protein GCM10010840_36340 [Deinococcus aerolatus]
MHILDVIDNLDEIAGYHVGGMVCIERQGKPWKINRVAALEGFTLTTETGHTYSVTTGEPLYDGKGICMRALTRERANYIMGIVFKKDADKIDLTKLSAGQLSDLSGAAHTVLTLLRDLRNVVLTAGRDGDRSRDGAGDIPEEMPVRDVIVFETPHEAPVSS